MEYNRLRNYHQTALIHAAIRQLTRMSVNRLQIMHPKSPSLLILRRNPSFLPLYSFPRKKMATKTQFAAAFLLLSMMCSSYASAQLLTCPLQLISTAVCGPLLGIISVGGLSTTLQNACCSLFSSLTANQTANCLCVTLKLSALGLQLSLPDAVSLVLTSCGKNLTIGACPWIYAKQKAPPGK